MTRKEDEVKADAKANQAQFAQDKQDRETAAKVAKAKEVAPHRLRMTEESDRLAEKVTKLSAFMKTDRYRLGVPQEEKHLLERQLKAMMEYADALSARATYAANRAMADQTDDESEAGGNFAPADDPDDVFVDEKLLGGAAARPPAIEKAESDSKKTK